MNTYKVEVEIEVPEGYELVKKQNSHKVQPLSSNKGIIAKIIKSPSPTFTKNDYNLCEDTNGKKMAFIGKGLAPTILEEHCIVLSREFDWEIVNSGINIILIPSYKF
jgi:hypothetical protein